MNTVATARHHGTIVKTGESPLLSLPPELRNRIYDLVFHKERGNNDRLAHAGSPSKALLLTCRQVFREARHMYAVSRRRYWAWTSFSAVAGLASEIRSKLRWLLSPDDSEISEREVACIERLELSSSHFHVRYWRGLWYCREDDDLCFAIVPVSDYPSELHLLPPEVIAYAIRRSQHMALVCESRDLKVLLDIVDSKRRAPLTRGEILAAADLFFKYY